MAQSAPCDLLLVDELGPLEMLRGQGFTAAQAALAGGRYRLGIAVVRPALVKTFSALLPPQRIVTPDGASLGKQQATGLWEAIAASSAQANAPASSCTIHTFGST